MNDPFDEEEEEEYEDEPDDVDYVTFNHPSRLQLGAPPPLDLAPPASGQLVVYRPRRADPNIRRSATQSEIANRNVAGDLKRASNIRSRNRDMFMNLVRRGVSRGDATDRVRRHMESEIRNLGLEHPQEERVLQSVPALVQQLHDDVQQPQQLPSLEPDRLIEQAVLGAGNNMASVRDAQGAQWGISDGDQELIANAQRGMQQQHGILASRSQREERHLGEAISVAGTQQQELQERINQLVVADRAKSDQMAQYRISALEDVQRLSEQLAAAQSEVIQLRRDGEPDRIIDQMRAHIDALRQEIERVQRQSARIQSEWETGQQEAHQQIDMLRHQIDDGHLRMQQLRERHQTTAQQLEAVTRGLLGAQAVAERLEQERAQDQMTYVAHATTLQQQALSAAAREHASAASVQRLEQEVAALEQRHVEGAREFEARVQQLREDADRRLRYAHETYNARLATDVYAQTASLHEEISRLETMLRNNREELNQRIHENMEALQSQDQHDQAIVRQIEKQLTDTRDELQLAHANELEAESQIADLRQLISRYEAAAHASQFDAVNAQRALYTVDANDARRDAIALQLQINDMTEELSHAESDAAQAAANTHRVESALMVLQDDEMSANLRAIDHHNELMTASDLADHAITRLAIQQQDSSLDDSHMQLALLQRDIAPIVSDIVHGDQHTHGTEFAGAPELQGRGSGAEVATFALPNPRAVSQEVRFNHPSRSQLGTTNVSLPIGPSAFETSNRSLSHSQQLQATYQPAAASYVATSTPTPLIPVPSQLSLTVPVSSGAPTPPLPGYGGRRGAIGAASSWLPMRRAQYVQDRSRAPWNNYPANVSPQSSPFY